MEQQTGPQMELTDFTDDVKRVFPVAPSLRRQNADLFLPFIEQDRLRDDNLFYSALARMFGGEGIDALRAFDRRMSSGRDEKKKFSYRGYRHLRNYAISAGISEEDILAHDFPPLSFEAKLNVLILALHSDDQVADSEAAADSEECGGGREIEDWAALASTIAEQANSLKTPDSITARRILELSERLVAECEKEEHAELEWAELTQRWQDLFERLMAFDAGLGDRLAKDLDRERLDEIEVHLTELEAAKNEVEKAGSELQSLNIKAREALDRDDLDAETRLMNLRRDAHSHQKELAGHAAAALRALEQFLPTEAGESAKDVEENPVAAEEVENEPAQSVETALTSISENASIAERLAPTLAGVAAGALDPMAPGPASKPKEHLEAGDSEATESAPERAPTDVNADNDIARSTEEDLTSKECAHEDGELEAELSGQGSGSPDHSSQTIAEERGSDLDLEADTEERSVVLARFLERGEVSFAWNLARLQEARGKTPTIPAAVLWALMLLRSVRSAEDVADEQRSSAMAAMMDALPRAVDKAAASRLALAALLRPALFDPFYGARNQLLNLPREDGLEDAVPLIQALAELGHDISLSEENLSDIAGAKRRDRLKASCDELSSWLQLARRRKTMHQPTYRIFHRELHPEGGIGKVIEAAIAIAPEAEALVGALLEKLDNNQTAQETFVSDVEKRTGRPKKDRIEGMALDWFCRNLQEACDLLQDWQKAHGEQAALPQDRQHDSLRRATGTIRRALEAVSEQVEADASTVGGLAAAADVVLRQGFEDLRGLLDGAGKLDSPRRIRDVSETPLLRLPGGCQDWTDHDDRAFDEERSRRDSRLLLALSRNEFVSADYRDAFRHRIEERAILASNALLDLMYGTGLAKDAELAENRQTLEETCAAARRDARDQVERLRQSFATISYLDLESGDEVRDILTQLSAITEALSADIETEDVTLPALSGARMATVPPDFPELNDVLSAFEDGRKRLTAAIADRQKLALESLSKGPLGASARTILAEMNRLDPVTVDDAIAELSAGRDVPLPAADASDEFERFFPGFVSDLDVANGGELARGPVIKALKEGGSIGPLDFSALEETGRRRARQLLEIWGGLENAMKQPRTDRLKETLEALLGSLGFTGVRLTDVREVTPGKLRRFIINCDKVRSDGWFLPPAFGSVAEGHYRGAVVRGDIGPEQILRVIGAEAPDQPWIVVILRRLNVRERRVLAQKARTEARQVLVLDESLLLYLAANGEDPLAGLFACTLPFGWVQPYVTRAGAIPSEMFFGRQEEISRILARDGGGCLIYGGRQLGKSALLNHIRAERHRPHSGELAIYLDIKPVGGVGMGPERIWDELHHELKVHPGISIVKQDVNEFVRAIEDWLKENPSRRLLVMFDEADNFLRAEHAGGYPNLQKLKGLMERTGMRFKAVFAGLHNVRRMAQAPNSPLPHLGEPICIGPMNQTRENRAALRKLATEPMRAAGLDYADPALASDMIARMNYYPSLVQVFCRQVVETIGRRAFAGQDGPRWRLFREALFEGEAAEKAAEQIRERFQLTLNLDVRYECIAKSLALRRLETTGGDTEVLSKGLSPSALLEFARSFWPSSLGQPRVSDIEELLKEMVDLGVLSDFGNGRYGLRSALVAQMLGTRDRLENDLLLLNERELDPAYDAAEFHSFLRPLSPTERAPLADRTLERLFDSSSPGLRLAIGPSALVGPDLGRRIKAAADIWRNSDNPLVGAEETTLRRTIDGLEKKHAVLVIEGAWKAKIAENLARQPSVIKGQVLPVWCLDQEPEVPLENFAVYRSLPWSDAMVRHWLVDENLAPILDDANSRRAIIKATGGAPARLKLLLPLLKELVAQSANDIGEQLHEWAAKNPVTLDVFGLDEEDGEFLSELFELGEAITSREEMQRELQHASENRIYRLTTLGLLHEGGSRDHIPTVTPLGLLLVE